MVQSWLAMASTSWAGAILLPQLSQVAGITGMSHHPWLFFLILFLFLVETGFHHVGQADLKLLTSGDPLALASQSAGITGVSHCTGLTYVNSFNLHIPKVVGTITFLF